MLQSFQCKCKYTGCRNISQDEKLNYFTAFYEKTYNEQTLFLKSCIEVKEPNRRRVEESISKRQCTVKYFLTVNKERMQVCQKHLCHILSTTRRRLQILVSKIKFDQPLEDQRGLHLNRPHRMQENDIETVKSHIRSFPAQESHYSRSSNKTKCLDPSLNTKKLFLLFKEKYPDSPIKFDTYRNIFKTDFDLRFGTPRSDTCKLCDRLYIQMIAAENDVIRSRICIETELHHRKAEKAYESLYKDADTSKHNNDVVTLCVDLQQVLFTPNLTHSDVFYQRQYSNYNYSVHNMGDSSVTMYLWHESLAKRESAEITSCLLQHIVHYYQVLPSGKERKLNIWSDRCVGQNNNFKMAILCNYLIYLGYFTEVNQKFLVSGHSFLPCDRDFALIERNKKSRKLYVPDDLVELIASSRQINPFQVFIMNQTHFLDLSSVESIFRRDSNLKITEARWIQLTADDPGVLRLRTCHNVLESWKTFELLKKKRGNRRPDVSVPLISDLPRLYNNPLPITAAKKSDLMSMSQYLPTDKRVFYETLTAQDV